MFRPLNSSVTVSCGPWTAIEAFSRDPASWLPTPADALGDGCWLAPLHVGALRRDVVIEVGPVWSLPDAWIRRVRWTASGNEAVFGGASAYLPSLSGRLTVRPSSGDEVRLTLEAHYVPPMGRLGTIIDAVALHRVAQSTADAFTAEVAQRLTVVAASPLGRDHGEAGTGGAMETVSGIRVRSPRVPAE